MALRDTQDVLLVEAGTTGKLRVSQDVLILEGPTASGHIRDTQDVLIFEVSPTVMAITYPLTPPAIAGIGPQDFSMTEQNVVGETESPFTLSQQEQQWPGQQLQIEMNLPPLVMAQAEQWIAFLGSLFGKFGTFLMGDYLRPTPQGAMTGSPVVSGSNPNGQNFLNVRGAAIGVANWAIAGDYIQITAPGGPQRIYKILQNAASDGAGNVVLDIFPNIRESLSDGTAIITANCKGTFRLQTNSVMWKVDRNKIYTISFKAKEAI